MATSDIADNSRLSWTISGRSRLFATDKALGGFIERGQLFKLTAFGLANTLVVWVDWPFGPARMLQQ